MTKTTEILNAVKEAIAQKLLNGHGDGYCYSPQEWELTELRYDTRSNHYYALIEIRSSNPGARSALYQIDASDPKFSTSGVEALVDIGTSEADFPDETVTIPL